MRGLGEKTREKALLDMLGAAEVPQCTDYPERLLLPPRIRTGRGEIVAATDEDMHARTTGFRYRAGRWCGGLIFKGTRPDAYSDSGAIGVRLSYTGVLAVQAYRPHVFLISHPSFRSEKVQAVIEEAQERAKDFQANVIPEGRADYAYMLPGEDEVAFMRRNRGGLIGTMVASVDGTFLALRLHIEDTLRSEAAEDRRGMVLAGQVIDEAHEAARSQPRDIAQVTILSATSRALQDKFACYFSGDPQAAYLERVA